MIVFKSIIVPCGLWHFIFALKAPKLLESKVNTIKHGCLAILSCLILNWKFTFSDATPLFSQALAKAEDESDVKAATMAHAEQDAELAEFDESIPYEGEEKDGEEGSKVEMELAQLDSQVKDCTCIVTVLCMHCSMISIPIRGESVLCWFRCKVGRSFYRYTSCGSCFVGEGFDVLILLCQSLASRMNVKNERQKWITLR